MRENRCSVTAAAGNLAGASSWILIIPKFTTLRPVGARLALATGVGVAVGVTAASVLSPASAASLGVGGLTAATGDGGAAITTELAAAAGPAMTCVFTRGCAVTGAAVPELAEVGAGVGVEVAMGGAATVTDVASVFVADAAGLADTLPVPIETAGSLVIGVVTAMGLCVDAEESDGALSVVVGAVRAGAVKVFVGSSAVAS